MKLAFNYPTGTYVVAVSGGVDSAVLLNVLVQQHPENSYIVANVNHGIRKDSWQDTDVARSYANKYQLPFEYTELHLGSSASEAEARAARYAFLKSVMNKHDAKAIITAHHQDDVIETMFINVVRGTGRRGLSSLKTSNALIRPMLTVPKSVIYSYAQQQKLVWIEDSTNNDTKYLRNFLRHKVVFNMDDQQRSQALEIINSATRINQLLDKELSHFVKAGLHKGGPVLNRRWFAQLPHNIALEVMYIVLSTNGATDINRDMLERAVVAVKTMRPGKTIQLSGGEITFTKRSARIKVHRKTDENTV